MHSLQSILGAIRHRDYLASIDIQEAYFHVPSMTYLHVRPSHRRFFHFCYNGEHFQYRAMPFGLSSAPCIFTKLLDVVATHLRAILIRVHCYLDDILIQSFSFQQVESDIQIMVTTLQNHGFTVNWEKSHLTSSTEIIHLGARICTLSGLVFLS